MLQVFKTLSISTLHLTCLQATPGSFAVKFRSSNQNPTKKKTKLSLNDMIKSTENVVTRKPNTTVTEPKPKFKLCPFHFGEKLRRDFMLTGSGCIMGADCPNAHSEEELFKWPDVKSEKKKTALCSDYTDGNDMSSSSTSNVVTGEPNTDAPKPRNMHKTKKCAYHFGKQHAKGYGCRLGDDCPFAHSEEELVSRTPFCGEFIRTGGHCRFGDNCKRSHGKFDRNNTDPSQLHVLQLQKTRMCENLKNGKCRFGSRCNFAHSEDEMQPKPDFTNTSICYGFGINGSCKHGDNCKYAHVAVNEVPEPVIKDNHSTHTTTDLNVTGPGNTDRSSSSTKSSGPGPESEVQAVAGPGPSNLRKLRMCVFAENGQCLRGNNCNFAHSEDELRSLPDYRNTSLCIAFSRKGVCRDGNSCKYAHGDEQLVPMKFSDPSSSSSSSSSSTIKAAAQAPTDTIVQKAAAEDAVPIMPSGPSPGPGPVPPLPTVPINNKACAVPVGPLPLLLTPRFEESNDADYEDWKRHVETSKPSLKETIGIFNLLPRDPVSSQVVNEEEVEENDCCIGSVPVVVDDGIPMKVQEPDSFNQKSHSTKLPREVFQGTKLCRYFLTGTCTRGTKCDFAHNEKEIKKTPNLWRTKLCKQFMKNGFCYLENNCNCAHGTSELKPLKLEQPEADSKNSDEAAGTNISNHTSSRQTYHELRIPNPPQESLDSSFSSEGGQNTPTSDKLNMESSASLGPQQCQLPVINSPGPQSQKFLQPNQEEEAEEEEEEEEEEEMIPIEVKDLPENFEEAYTTEIPKEVFKGTRLCKFFSVGKCTRGSDCVFAHDEKDITEKPDLRKTKLCKRLLNYGNCFRGDSCNYAHNPADLVPMEIGTNLDDHEATNVSTIAENNQMVKSEEVQDHTTEIPSSRLRGLFKGTRPCRFFSLGKCTRGTECVFAHGEAKARPDLTKTKLCKNIMETGYCYSGKKCKFAHNQAELKQLEVEQPGSKNSDEAAATDINHTTGNTRLSNSTSSRQQLRRLNLSNLYQNDDLKRRHSTGTQESLYPSFSSGGQSTPNSEELNMDLAWPSPQVEVPGSQSPNLRPLTIVCLNKFDGKPQYYHAVPMPIDCLSTCASTSLPDMSNLSRGSTPGPGIMISTSPNFSSPPPPPYTPSINTSLRPTVTDTASPPPPYNSSIINIGPTVSSPPKLVTPVPQRGFLSSRDT